MLSGLPDLTLANKEVWKNNAWNWWPVSSTVVVYGQVWWHSSLHSEAWHSRLVITVKFGGIKLGGLRSSSVAFKLYSEVWWCHSELGGGSQ